MKEIDRYERDTSGGQPSHLLRWDSHSCQISNFVFSRGLFPMLVSLPESPLANPAIALVN